MDPTTKEQSWWLGRIEDMYRPAGAKSRLARVTDSQVHLAHARQNNHKVVCTWFLKEADGTFTLNGSTVCIDREKYPASCIIALVDLEHTGANSSGKQMYKLGDKQAAETKAKALDALLLSTRDDAAPTKKKQKQRSQAEREAEERAAREARDAADAVERTHGTSRSGRNVGRLVQMT